jgi:type II secretory ATPase GspE/PulE/Tfp pilus assembly ATPase PilB-like protein
MLMQTLLKQVLSEGIGRLYFERQAHSGKVLCSQDGVLQSVVDDLSLDLFQSVINELKRLTHLPLLPVTTTRQAEIERLYHQDRVLLRLRIIAGTHGEEATLQVLRGAALKFHQQQQIEQLGRDALGIAQTLQQRIHAIRDRSRQSLVSDSPPTATLLAVSNMLKAIETQINQLLQAHEHTDRS